MATPSLGLLAGLDEEVLRQRTEAPACRDLWQYLLERWEGVVALEAETDGYLNQGSLAWHSITPMVVEAALIARLTGRADALDYVRRCIGYLLSEYEGLTTFEGLSPKPYVLSHGEVALAADLCRDALGAETRQPLAAVMRMCIDYTALDGALAGYGCGGNVPLCRNVNAGVCALTWGAESGHPAWQRVVDGARDNVRQYLRHGCDADGYSYEGTGYGHAVFMFIYAFAQLLRQRGWDDLFAREPLLERIADAAQTMLLGDRSFLATTNDLGTGSPFSCWWLLLTARYYDRPDHLGFWQAFQGPTHPIRPWGDIWPWWARRAGQDERTIVHADNTLLWTFLHYDADAPVQPLEHSTLPTASCAPGTGTAAFRTSWRTGATFACLLGGGRSHTCFGHAHADCGHFGIAVGGEYLAIDTGRYNTNEDQHSVVLIDGENRMPSSREGAWGADRRSGMLRDFHRHPLLDTCCADASHMKNCIWAKRHFFFIRCGGDDAYIVMLDNINTDQRPHRYGWQLQAHPDSRVEITGDHTAGVVGSEARLDCHFFIKPAPAAPDHSHSLSLRTDVQEWVWPYGRDQDTTVFERTGTFTTSVRRPRLIAEHHGPTCMLLSVIVPRRKDRATPTIAQERCTNGFRLRIDCGDFVDTFVAAPDHAYIETPGISGLAEFALVRRDPDETLLDWWVADGGELHLEDA